MIRCKSCERKDRKIQEQEVLISRQREQLEAIRDRTKRLEQALREICDYAEVCEHSPARPLLVSEQ
jgi:hypothetical protein